MIRSGLLKYKNKYGGVIILFILLSVGSYLYKKSEDLTRFYVPDIRKTYTGRIIEKSIGKTSIIKIRSSNEMIRISDIEDDFWNTSKIGDSLYKPKNLNYVYLIRKDTILRLHYLYVPNSVLNDPKWPVEPKYN